MTALVSSSSLSSIRTTAAAAITEGGFLYTVSISPPLARTPPGEIGVFNVKVSRGSDAGHFSVGLSLAGNLDPLIRSAVSIYPPEITLEEGQTYGNSTMKVNTKGLTADKIILRVQAVTVLPADSDRVISNQAVLLVKSGDTLAGQSSGIAPKTDSVIKSKPTIPSSSPQPLKKGTEPSQKVLNGPPVAKAGQDLVVKEGDSVILDGSASTDPNNDRLSFSWGQLSPRQPNTKFSTDNTASRVTFISPSVDRDTDFKFKLTVSDGKGGTAADSINILVKNVEGTASNDNLTRPEVKDQQKTSPSQITENHSPIAEAAQSLISYADKQLSIKLHGNDNDKDDKLEYVIAKQPSHGTIAGFNKASGTLTYVPISGFTGTDIITFRVTDNHGANSNDGLVVIRVITSGKPSLPSSPEGASGAFSAGKPDRENVNSTIGTTTSTNSSRSQIPLNNSSNEIIHANSSLGSSINASQKVLGLTSSESSSGKQKGAPNGFSAASVVAGEVYQFVRKWSGHNGAFNNPHAIAMDSQGNAYVLDSGNNRVQKYDSNGNFILQWGTQGAGNGQFNNPSGIAIDRSSGNVYVVDTGNNRVQKFSNKGDFLIKWGNNGSGNSQFSEPVGVGIDSSGNVYVTDVNNHRIAKFNSNGIFLTKWGSTGSGQGQFKGPHGIAVDGANNVFVSDFMNNKVQKFTSAGAFISSFGSAGTSDGKFNEPHGVAVDSDNSVYVTDRGNNRVQKFSNAGVFLTKFGTGGTGDGQFSGPDGIAIAPSGSVYVTDIGNKRVQVFAIHIPGPDAPTLISPGNNAFTNNNKPSFDWTDITGTGISYSLLVDNDTGFSSPEISVGSLSTSSFTSVNALSDGVYYWKVNSKDGANNVSPFSSVFSFTLDTVAPLAVSASPVGGLFKVGQSVTLTLPPSEPATTKIYYTTDGITDPTRGSNLYVGAIPIVVEGQTTLKFRAIDLANNLGPVGTEVYVLDKTAPTILGTQPKADAIDVPVNSVIKANFSEAMNVSSINANNFKLFADGGLTPVNGNISLSSDSKIVTFTPSSPLTGSNYTVTIKGGATGVRDQAGNVMTTDYTWSFSTPPKITMTLDSFTPKWGKVVNANVTVTGNRLGDKISIDWGDNNGSPSDIITPIPASGKLTTTHVYDVSAMSPMPQKSVLARLLNSQNAERASTGVISITLQKHATSLTIGMKPSADDTLCADCHFTVFGKMVDIDTIPSTQIGAKTITFSGSGVPDSLSQVQTQGVKFSGAPGKNLTLTSHSLQMPVGSEISLPSATHGITYQFSNGVQLKLTKGNGQEISNLGVPAGTSQNADFPEGLNKITITGVTGGGSTAEMSMLITRDLATDGPDDNQIAIDFSNNIAQPGGYAVLTIEPGSYFSTGVTQGGDGSGLAITAEFGDTSDPAYLTSSAQLSYDVDSSKAGTGEGNVIAYVGTVWTKLSVGTGTAGDACTRNGVASLDQDKDGICDRWEDSATSGNDATHRYVTCPTAAGPVAIDPLCPNTDESVKYDLCFADGFASVWGNKANGDRICPSPNHKDIYVEIDYMANHQPSATAIRNVIKAFGNAPFSGQTADAFGRTTGITLHVMVSDQFSRVAPYKLWDDTGGVSDGNNGNDFRHVKDTLFGNAAERGGTSGMPGMTAAAWTSTGKVQKHYVYHYGQWITYYGGSCTSSGLSSGLAELLGNDFVVSLGCGFGGTDPAGGSIGSDDEQAGTFMHELGHNLNLGHGGVASLVVGSTNYNMNCKPNYLSVMNYARQLPNAVLDSASWESGFNYAGAGTQTSLDYARSTVPDISEGTANEGTTMSSSDGKQYWIEYGTPTKVPAVRKALSGTTIDFDGSGAKTGTPSVDLNVLSPTIAGCGPKGNPSTFPNSPDTPDTLKSYSDWDKINLVFTPDGDSQDGVVQRVSLPFINKNTQELKPIFLQSIQNSVNQISFIPPPNPDGSTTFNTGSTVPLKFRLTDKDGKPITNAVVTLVAQKGSTIIVGSTPFTFISSQKLYKYDWTTPAGTQGRGEWTLKYILNYQSTNPSLPQSLLQGPNALGDYTLKITGVT